jgi:predicted metal-binding protein
MRREGGHVIPRTAVRTFIRHALELGALEAKLIEASSIVTAPWVRMKCLYGCGGYNTSLCCPPHSPPHQETREMVSCYKHAILLRCKDVGISTSIVCEMERRIFLAGYYKAFGFGNTPCRQCGSCNLKRCSHAEQARPSMEACGIDVYATVRANGYPIEVVKDSSCEANYYGLVLIE